MPHFEVMNQDRSISRIVQADTDERVLEEAKRKFGLTCECELMMDDGITPVDEDFMSFAAANPTTLNSLMIVVIGQAQHALEVNQRIPNGNNPGASQDQRSSQVHDLAPILAKIDNHLLEHCRNGVLLCRDRRSVIARAVRDHMMHDLKDTSYNTAGIFAEMMCNKFPDSFSVGVRGEKWNDGISSLKLSIYNAIQHEKGKKNGKKSDLPDSDHE
ncbi:hypothetical protein QAD02_008049 [Eretmocerus hayati]|uniref:Uncharacterized protein n=1 Tax=Eretmocerus hayati TaxID=131215 RepID=A0ACC2N7T0_9HYME|nr:hypothetical protein QAD02_008049 [Eretmocerus hayati]